MFIVRHYFRMPLNPKSKFAGSFDSLDCSIFRPNDGCKF